MKILVTGSAGFIGSALVLRLLARGDTVIGIDNHNNYYDPALKEARLARHAKHPNYTHLRIKLRHLDEMTQHKRAIAEIYFGNLPNWLRLPRRRDDEYDVFHIFGVRHPRRDELRAWLLERGVKTEIHYPIPPHQQKAMAGILLGSYPIAEELHVTELSLPISVGHTEDDIRTICGVFNEATPRFLQA